MNYNRDCCRQTTRDNLRRRGVSADSTGNKTCAVRGDRSDMCGRNDVNYNLATVYSPYQDWQNIYDGEKALENGTIFAELDKPFAGRKCCGRGANCL